MSSLVPADVLEHYRYQCEERVRRWERGSAVPEWHVGITETLAVLDHIRIRERQLDVALGALQEIQKAIAAPQRTQSVMRRIINQCEARVANALAEVVALSNLEVGPIIYKAGERVRYHPVIGEEHDGNVYTVALGPQDVGGTECYWLIEKVGAVAAAALSPCEAPDG